jgi:predicted amidophosphoribosyltransferase
MNKNRIRIRRMKCNGCGKGLKHRKHGGMYYCDMCLKEYKEHKSPNVLGRNKENEDE